MFDFRSLSQDQIAVAIDCMRDRADMQDLGPFVRVCELRARDVCQAYATVCAWAVESSVAVRIAIIADHKVDRRSHRHLKLVSTGPLTMPVTFVFAFGNIESLIYFRMRW